MERHLKYVILLMLVIISTRSFSQKKDTLLQGIVRDSAHNYVLEAVTIAIYKVSDSSLVSYQLSNNFGEFSFKSLPSHIPLKLIASYIGYKTVIRQLTISADKKMLLNMERGTYSLNEVSISAVVPVRLKGDTLEFNADAFTLDKNAVAEDLLRKLPGVTLWGDGTITINGRPVNQVLVDGKPFFGGQTRIATQNIPKDAIDKVQVYREAGKQQADSTLDVNIKLKANKRTGYFGKLGAGYGTDQRYEADANLNLFSPHTQIGIIGAVNNTNKTVSDVSQLMLNSTFKGTGATVDYQPDFNISGYNKSAAGGFTLQHDFDPTPDLRKQSLSARYFFKRNISELLSNSQTVTALGGDSTNTFLSNNNNGTTTMLNDFSTSYSLSEQNHKISLSGGIHLENNDFSTKAEQNSTSSTIGLQSTNTMTTAGNSDASGFSMQAGYYKQENYNKLSIGPANLELEYRLNTGRNHDVSFTTTDFKSLQDPATDYQLQRNYEAHDSHTDHHLHTLWGNLSNSLFGAGTFLSTIQLNLKNEADLHIEQQSHVVKDKEADKYVINDYLTNDSRYTNIDERPGISLSKAIVHSLNNRYEKRLIFNVDAIMQIYYQHNTSDHTFQNFTKNYEHFIPTAKVSYTNHQSGRFENSYALNYNASADYPTVNQLYPLVDSSNIYLINKGNPALRNSSRHQLSLDFTHAVQSGKNDFSYSVNISGGVVDHYLGDSLIVNESGGYVHYNVNVNGYKYGGAAANINKAIKIKGNHQIQVSLSANVKLSHTPSYLQGMLNFSDNTNTNGRLSATYTFTDVLAVNLLHDLNWYHSAQDGFSSNEFSSSLQKTSCSVSLNCTGKLNVSSNVTYNHATFSALPATNFGIWNASTAYRFLPGNNLELKLSALDLLHQNKGIINYGNNLSITRESTNVLQQYFIVTLSWFPRKFGKGNH